MVWIYPSPALTVRDGDDLVVIIYLLSDPKHDYRLVLRALDLLHAASCCKP